MDKKKLRGKIIEKFGTQEKFAKEVLGVSRAHFSVKMTTGMWSLEQMLATADALDLTPDEAAEIFFAENVAKNATKKVN